MGERVGAGVVSTTGVSPVDDTEGAAPLGWEDVQPAMSRASTAIHIAPMTNEVFIRASPLLPIRITVMIFMGLSGGHWIYRFPHDGQECRSIDLTTGKVEG